MNIGRRIYYDKLTGDIVLDTGERTHAVVEQSVEYQTQTYRALSERNRESFDVIELEFGQYAQDFAECNGYRVNPETKELEFSYPDPNEPEQPPVYEKPLSEQIKELKAENLATMGAVAEVYEMLLGGM